MRDLIKGRGFVMLLHNDLVKVFCIKAYAKGIIRFAGVCKGQYPFGGPRDNSYDTFDDHDIKGALYLLSVLYGYLPLGVLDQGNRKVGLVLMLYVPGMLPIMSDELGKAHFRATVSWATAVVGVDVLARLGVRGLRADLGCLLLGEEGEQGLGLVSLVADLGPLQLEGEDLCDIELLMRFLNQTVFFVFLVLLGGELPQGGDVQYGRVTRGS